MDFNTKKRRILGTLRFATGHTILQAYSWVGSSERIFGRSAQEGNSLEVIMTSESSSLSQSLKSNRFSLTEFLVGTS